MAGVAQLVEHRIVTPVVAGSIPVARPITEQEIPELILLVLQRIEIRSKT